MDRVDVLPFSAEAITRLAGLGLPATTMARHRERWAMQQRGEARYLVAWRAGEPVGRVTVLGESKYVPVRDRLGSLVEMNALEATPQGQGVGTRLIHAAEADARAGGARWMGLAVAPDNPGAQRLYERLGYRDWGHAEVLDEWTERDAEGAVVAEHRTPCRYLVKALES